MVNARSLRKVGPRVRTIFLMIIYRQLLDQILMKRQVCCSCVFSISNVFVVMKKAEFDVDDAPVLSKQSAKVVEEEVDVESNKHEKDEEELVPIKKVASAIATAKGYGTPSPMLTFIKA